MKHHHRWPFSPPCSCPTLCILSSSILYTPSLISSLPLRVSNIGTFDPDTTITDDNGFSAFFSHVHAHVCASYCALRPRRVIPLWFHVTVTLTANMSHEEELVDYDEAAEEFTAPVTAAATNGAKADGGDKKGSYVGIHSTGFRCVDVRSTMEHV